MSPRRESRGRARRAGRTLACAGLVLLTSAACAVSCEPNLVPDPLTCTNPAADATLEELELATGPRTPPVALEDGGATYAIAGAEGELMISLRTIFGGADAPACARVALRVSDPGTGLDLYGTDLALTSTPVGPRRVSSEVFVLAEGWPAEVEVQAMMYGRSVTRRVQVGGYVADAGALPVDAAMEMDAAVDADGAGDAAP